MNVIKEINQINKVELENGYVNTSASWHTKYANSAWVYAGNLPTQLSEGDVLSILSQFGEMEDIHLVREESTGKSKGFAFCKYEDCRSCVLAVDNFNGTKLLGRSMRVDHVENYRLPKHVREKEEEMMALAAEGGGADNGTGIDGAGAGTSTSTFGAGHAYEGQELKNSFDINAGQDLFAPVQDTTSNTNNDNDNDTKRKEKEARKKERENKRREKERRKEERDERRRLKRGRKMARKEKEKKQKRSKTGSSDTKTSRRRYDSDDDRDDSSSDDDDGHARRSS